MSSPILLTAPQGHNVVDCSANPFDVRPYVRAIMDRANFLYRENGKPTVILMGERHGVITHLAAFQMVVKNIRVLALQGGIKPALGLEVPHNYFAAHEAVLPKKEGLSPDEIAGYCFSRALSASKHPNALSALFLQNAFAAMVVSGVRNLPQLSTSLNDAANVGQSYDESRLDQNDPITVKYINLIFNGELPDDNLLHPQTIAGLAIRNAVMVERMLAHVKEVQAQVYVQHCGATHTKGLQHSFITGALSDYEDSLEAGLLDEGGVNVVSCYASSDYYQYVPVLGKLQNAENTIVAQGLSQKRFKSTILPFSRWFKLEERAMRRIEAATQGAYKIHI